MRFNSCLLLLVPAILGAPIYTKSKHHKIRNIPMLKAAVAERAAVADQTDSDRDTAIGVVFYSADYDVDIAVCDMYM